MTKVEFVTRVHIAMLSWVNFIGERFPADSNEPVTAADMHAVGEKAAHAVSEINDLMFDLTKEV